MHVIGDQQNHQFECLSVLDFCYWLGIRDENYKFLSCCCHNFVRKLPLWALQNEGQPLQDTLSIGSAAGSYHIRMSCIAAQDMDPAILQKSRDKTKQKQHVCCQNFVSHSRTRHQENCFCKFTEHTCSPCLMTYRTWR